MPSSATFMNVPTIKVSFAAINVNTDTITALDSATYGPIGSSGIPVTALVNTDSSWWIQPDINGQMQLCTTKCLHSKMIITYMRAGASYSRTADPFTIAYHDEAGLPVYMPFPAL